MPPASRKYPTYALALWIAASCLPAAGLAQTNTENFAQFRFNFNNPGARATGIGERSCRSPTMRRRPKRTLPV